MFYLIFYAILAALFAICMQGLFATLSDEYPKWKLKESIIGTNPGLGFRPISDQTELGSLIHFNASDPETIKPWVKNINNFLQRKIKKICVNIFS